VVVTDGMALMALNVYDYAVATAPPAQNRTAPMKAALTAALANMWRPIEEAPRKRSTKFLALTQSGKIRIDWYAGYLGEFFFEEPDDRYTHFMPLPAPPAAVGGG